jgi:hypothetical protein
MMPLSNCGYSAAAQTETIQLTAAREKPTAALREEKITASLELPSR